ncbi:hypothetical protein HanPI659440_Chr16g0637571 [Helianthus annuus]|nr:hypothetical protein HanPI659440_Chr16g0637571 [Helianthus annuus]
MYNVRKKPSVTFFLRIKSVIRMCADHIPSNVKENKGFSVTSERFLIKDEIEEEDM